MLYYVFAYDTFYPGGGMRDYRGQMIITDSAKNVQCEAMEAFPGYDKYDVYTVEDFHKMLADKTIVMK